MSELRVTITPLVDFKAQSITLQEAIDAPWDDLFKGRLQRFQAHVVNLRDKATRDALIRLGWRPPEETPKTPTRETIERVRAHDPGTSVSAAEKAATFAQSHVDRIKAALIDTNRTAAQIAQVSGLTVVQVARRTHEMRKAGIIDVVRAANGEDLERDGFRVWMLL